MDTATSDQSLLTSDAGTADTTAATEQNADTTATADAGTQPTDKPAEGAKVEDEGTTAEDKKEAPAGAPEKYEAFTLPEGMEVDEELLAEFTPTLKELGLTQAAAQKVMDFAPKLIERTVQQTTAALLDQVGMADRASWSESSRTDKEFGGDKLNENLAVAQKAMTAFGTPELRAVLNKTGLGNHPELIRAFVRAGKAISEDGYVPGGKTTTVANPAVRVYDASNMNP